MFSAKDLFFASQGGYRISNSLRFRSSASAYLNRTYSSPTNNRIWSLSVWVKRGSLATNQAVIGTTDNNLSSANVGAIRFTSSNTLEYFEYSSAYTIQLITTQVFRDPSSWYHIVIAVDTTQATASNRIKMYVNGTQIAAFGTSTYPSLNYNPYINSAIPHYFGAYNNSATGLQSLTDGYFTEVNFIDGQALTPSSFGETDAATGVWMPKAYTGTYGTNGFYLKFDEVGATTTTNTGYGKDSSGNANRWTTNNFGTTSTATTYDSMVDTPTNYDNGGNGAGNYCVINPLDVSPSTVANGNLTISYATNADTNRAATFGVNSGKWYWETTITAVGGTYSIVGVTSGASTATALGSSSYQYGYISSTGNKFNNGSAVAYGATYTTGDVIGIALDMDAGTLVFYKNNASQGTAYTGLTGTFYPAFNARNASSNDANFGQRPFTYTPPSGFKALNTQNLTTPTILAGNKYFDATTYTGNSSTQNVTNSGSFQPDFVWIKNRTSALSHYLSDTVRGAYKILFSNLTNVEYDGASNSDGVSAFNSNGFTLLNGTNALNYNATSNNYVAWQWNAASSDTTNTSGSVTSVVRANVTAGFSVVRINAPGASTFTFGHGLNAVPKMVIIKSRTSATSWVVYHASATTISQYLLLNSTTAVASVANIWGTSNPTSTLMGGNGNQWGTGSDNYIAYCFADVAGYSAFGSYTGNGSADGPFVYLGFRPRYIMIKNIADNTTAWSVWDTTRSPYNIPTERLEANASAAESSLSQFDLLSNGFKLRSNNSNNASGQTIIYAAFAENPFKISRAR